MRTNHELAARIGSPEDPEDGTPARTPRTSGARAKRSDTGSNVVTFPKRRLTPKVEAPRERRERKRVILTDMGIRSLKPEPGKQRVVHDAVCRGLYVIVSPAGARTFMSRYKLHDKWQSRSIGRLGENVIEGGTDSSVSAAREQVRKDRALAAKGIDPKVAARATELEAARTAYTTEQAISDFVEYKKQFTHSWDQLEGSLRRNCKAWLSWPVSSITKHEVQKHIAGLMKQGKKSAAVHALTDIKQFFRWLSVHDHIADNSIRDLPAPAPKGSKDRVYTSAELKAIWKAAGKLTKQECVYVRMCMLLVPRKTSLAMLKWSELNDDRTVWTNTEWTKTKKTSAKKRTYVTPLSPFVRDLLKGLRRDPDQPRVFSSLNVWWSKADRPCYQSGPLENALIRYGAPKDFTLHPLRATCGTWLQEQGETEWHVGLVLNNGVGGVSVTGAHYMKGHAIKEKTRLLNAWEAHIRKIVA